MSGPYTRAAALASPPTRCFTTSGSTGMMSPKPITSSSNVTKMNPAAGVLRGGLLLTERDVDASRGEPGQNHVHETVFPREHLGGMHPGPRELPVEQQPGHDRRGERGRP